MTRARREWELADAFVRAHYHLPEGRGALTFACAARGAGAMRAADVLPRGRWAIVSAANPWSVAFDDAENAKRMERLAGEIMRAGLTARPMHNSAADGGWKEPSLLVEGVAREQVLRWCWRFGQAAAVTGVGAWCGVLWTRSERWVVLPARVVRAGGGGEIAAREMPACSVTLRP